MAIPTFQMVMLPLLKYCANNPQEHRIDELIEVIIKHFKLTEEEQLQLQNIIVLINQQKLLSLMIQYNIGVSLEKTYEIKKLDSDYFPED